MTFKMNRSRQISVDRALLEEIAAYIEERYVDHRADASIECCMPMAAKRMCEADTTVLDEELREQLRRMDESFSQMVLRKIDEQGWTDAACYKKAHMDRKLFSKIRADVRYKPSKATAVALALALELSPEEADELLKKAGFALSHSHPFDIIIEYCICHGMYDLSKVNEVLYAFDQNLLGV